jgi:hypothetical protein
MNAVKTTVNFDRAAGKNIVMVGNAGPFKTAKTGVELERAV